MTLGIAPVKPSLRQQMLAGAGQGWILGVEKGRGEQPEERLNGREFN